MNWFRTKAKLVKEINAQYASVCNRKHDIAYLLGKQLSRNNRPQKSKYTIIVNVIHYMETLYSMHDAHINDQLLFAAFHESISPETESSLKQALAVLRNQNVLSDDTGDHYVTIEAIERVISACLKNIKNLVRTKESTSVIVQIMKSSYEQTDRSKHTLAQLCMGYTAEEIRILQRIWKSHVGERQCGIRIQAAA